MAPRSDETAWIAQPNEQAAVDTDHEKPTAEEAAQDEAQATVDPIVSVTADFCSNVFGTLFGTTKKCEHCQMKLLHSEARIKEENGGIKTYFHPECKAARVALEEQKKVLHNDLMQYFEIKAEMARRAESEHMAAVLEAERCAVAERVVSEKLEADRAAPAPAPKKQGFFTRLFGGCRSNRAVV